MQRSSKTQMKRITTKNKKIAVSDEMFIDFYRCLYQAKSIVRDLASFSDSVYPALRLYPNLISNDSPSTALITTEQEEENTRKSIDQVNQYLETTFCKFTRLCQILMLVLYKMENSNTTDTDGSDSSSTLTPTLAPASRSSKRNCIDSFRVEVIEEWRTATSIKEKLIHLIAFNGDNSIVPVNTQIPTTVGIVPDSMTSSLASSTSSPSSISISDSMDIIDISETNSNSSSSSSNNDGVPSIS